MEGDHFGRMIVDIHLSVLVNRFMKKVRMNRWPILKRAAERIFVLNARRFLESFLSFFLSRSTRLLLGMMKMEQSWKKVRTALKRHFPTRRIRILQLFGREDRKKCFVGAIKAGERMHQREAWNVCLSRLSFSFCCKTFFPTSWELESKGRIGAFVQFRTERDCRKGAFNSPVPCGFAAAAWLSFPINAQTDFL